MDQQHDVEQDRAGVAGFPRFTCYPCKATLIRQPYMTAYVWQRKRAEFLASHPIPEKATTIDGAEKEAQQDQDLSVR